jgi:hypothetical protein
LNDEQDHTGFEANLGYGLNGGFELDYGLDTLGPGYQEGDAPTLKNQTIAAYNLPNPMYMWVHSSSETNSETLTKIVGNLD